MINAFLINMKNSSTFGYYKTKSEVKNAIQQFNTIGVNKDEISIFYPEQNHLPFAKEYTNQLKIRALFGALIGIFVFALFNFLLFFKFLPQNLLPIEKSSFGSYLIAQGFVKAILIGSIIGAIIGTLTGSRRPKDNFPNEKDISPGNILFSVKLSPHQDEAQVKEVFRTSGASDIDTAKNSESWEIKILPLT